MVHPKIEPSIYSWPLTTSYIFHSTYYCIYCVLSVIYNLPSSYFKWLDASDFPPPAPQLQAPSVKGFDFAKLHLGQHSKDDIMVIQEPVPSGPGPGAQSMPTKDGFSPSKNGDVPTPASKNSSSKASRSSRRRER